MWLRCVCRSSGEGPQEGGGESRRPPPEGQRGQHGGEAHGEDHAQRGGDEAQGQEEGPVPAQAPRRRARPAAAVHAGRLPAAPWPRSRRRPPGFPSDPRRRAPQQHPRRRRGVLAAEAHSTAAAVRATHPLRFLRRRRAGRRRRRAHGRRHRAAAPKKATKPKKAAARKREREEPADAAAAAAAGGVAGEPKKKKKKKLAELNGVAVAAAGKPGLLPAKVDHDLKQVISELQSLPLVASYVAGRRSISDEARSFLLAFRSKSFKKSHENDPPEDNKASKPNAATAADGQKPPAKKKPAARPGDTTAASAKVAGVKRAPSDRQEELATKKKAKLNKIKTLATDKKAAGLELAAAAPAAARKNDAIAARKKEKEPALAPAIKTPSPTALMMKFPPKTTLPSVASLKARFARFGPLDVDGIRVYWKSHMCRVIYRFKSDADVALKYARANTTMFGQVAPNYYLRGVESDGDLAADAAPPPPQQRSELRLMETAPFRPGTSGGNCAPLPLSRPCRRARWLGSSPSRSSRRRSPTTARRRRRRSVMPCG